MKTKNKRSITGFETKSIAPMTVKVKGGHRKQEVEKAVYKEALKSEEI